jgi:hypothetical protein
MEHLTNSSGMTIILNQCHHVVPVYRPTQTIFQNIRANSANSGKKIPFIFGFLDFGKAEITNFSSKVVV